MTPSEIMQLVTGMKGYIGDVTKIPFDRVQHGRDLVWEYNRTRPSDTRRQQELLRQILGTYNEKVIIQPGIAFDYGFKIGANATICGGVHVGDGVVIGAGAVVLHDIPSHTVVAGVPARKIRDITPDARIPEQNIEF